MFVAIYKKQEIIQCLVLERRLEQDADKLTKPFFIIFTLNKTSSLTQLNYADFNDSEDLGLKTKSKEWIRKISITRKLLLGFRVFVAWWQLQASRSAPPLLPLAEATSTPSIVSSLTYALAVIPRSALSSLFVALFSDSTKPYRTAENDQFLFFKWFGFVFRKLGLLLSSQFCVFLLFLNSVEEVLINLSLR